MLLQKVPKIFYLFYFVSLHNYQFENDNLDIKVLNYLFYCLYVFHFYDVIVKLFSNLATMKYRTFHIYILAIEIIYFLYLVDY